MGHTSRNFIRAGVALSVVLAATAGSASSDYFLKLDGIDSPRARHKGEIEIQSFSWGASRVSDGSYDALTDGLLLIRYMSAVPASGAAGGGAAGKVSMQDISVMRGPRQTAATDGVKVAAGDLDGDGRADIVAPRDAASGQATGKRQHKPIRMRGYYDSAAPLAAGSLTIAGQFPGCTVGKRYPKLTLAGRGKRFGLQDAIITSCARGTFAGEAVPMEEVSFNYAKIQY